MKKLKLYSIAGMTFPEGVNAIRTTAGKEIWEKIRFGTISKVMIRSSNPLIQRCHMEEMMDNDVSINSYLRDLITTTHFLRSP